MKNLYIVSKTHLDLGFTDYAENIKKKYLTKFIPSAIDLAEKLNASGKKKYVWTTGSWLIKEALESGNAELRAKTEKALKDGNIAPHALAFTTHTELMDEDLLEYNLSIAKKIDEISGFKTVAAKMTDVPGHTKAIVPALAKNGIKLLHIGINTAAAYPKVPECFVWKCGNSEVVVIYADGYGGEFKCPYIDEILYFDNAADNHGTDSQNKILKTIGKLQKKYPDYNIVAGRLDDIAESLWAVRDKLPVVEDEIGDTWIHGAATDPYKVAAFRTLCNLKNKWIENGKLSKESAEYEKFADNLLCICEHTWGLDNKMHFCDNQHYTKEKFQKARKKDVVRLTNIFSAFPFNLTAAFTNTFGNKHYRYSTIEKSWLEQRQYLINAINCLPIELKFEAEQALANLIPNKVDEPKGAQKYNFNEQIKIGDYILWINEKGGINLLLKDKIILSAQEKPLVNYFSYSPQDYKNYAASYLRHKQPWAVADNLMPGLSGKSKYPIGVFPYKITNTSFEKNNEEAKIIALFECDQEACINAGAPQKISCEYLLTKAGVRLKIIWENKDAVRTTESLSTHFYPLYDSTSFVKIGTKIDTNHIVSHGGRNLSVIEKAQFEKENLHFEISSVECPLISSTGGNVMKFDDSKADLQQYGLSYIMHDNLWSTNFPLWYEENAIFTFSISGYIED